MGALIPDTGSPAIPSTGSIKCDAYLWAKHRYLDSGRCSAEVMAFYIDAYWLRDPCRSGLVNCTLSNHDYFISKRAFFFDLGVWPEESSVDEPGQPPGADYRTLQKLLRSMVGRAGGKIFSVGGFLPWAWKYSDYPGAGSRHGGVDSEWQYARLLSAYNGAMDADALGYSAMSNASFYRHFPLAARYPQHRRRRRRT